MTENMSQVFDGVKVWYLVIVWLLLGLYLPGANYVVSFLFSSQPWYWWDIGYIYYWHLLFGGAVCLALLYPNKLPVRSIVGRKPTGNEFVAGLLLTGFLFVLAWAAVYVLFFPLSFLAPTFVQYWYIDLPKLIFYDYGDYPIAANLLNLISLCVLAPVLEELAFRGILLQKWAYRFGMVRAILASSLLFGIVHPDPLGAFCFGVGMCVLYLRTQTLVLPIVCHGIYNLVVWFFEIGYMLSEGPEYIYTLEQFQSEWPYGLAAMIIVIVWSFVYLIRRKVDVLWKLPVQSR